MLVDPVADNGGLKISTKGLSYEASSRRPSAATRAWASPGARWEHAGFRLTLTMPPPTSLGGEFPSRHAP